MALPRPALLGILGALLIVATFMATHVVGKKSSTSPPTTTAVTTHVTKAPAKQQVTKTKAATTTHKAASKTSSSAGKAVGSSVGLPLNVAKALAAKRTVVLYFGARGADDTLTAVSVRALKASAGRGVAVFMDKLSNLADYRRVVEGLDVSQAPSIVIVDRSRNARLLEGFIDAGSLRQAVADVAG
jgi:hypothetical protein